MCFQYRFDYLSLLRESSWNLTSKTRPQEPVSKLQTVVPEYAYRVSEAAKRIRDYFNNPDERPFSLLVLGAPGAGKTFLAKRLASASKAEEFFEINCSRFGTADDIARELQKVALDRYAKKFVFIDEFDVTLAGSSVTRYLIEPMYDGKDCIGKRFGKTVFVFCGSYLRDLNILRDLEERGAAINLPAFLSKLLIRAKASGRQLLKDFFVSAIAVDQMRATASPEVNVLAYLRRLEKLADFLSRINGPVVEIPDIAKPLEVAQPFLLISSHHGARHLSAVELFGCSSPKYLQSFVERTESSDRADGSSASEKWLNFHFGHASQPILAFKNMIIYERLLRVCIITRSKYKKDRLKFNAADLNYLTLVPLAHGMRSLETIITKFSETDNNNHVHLKLPKGDPALESQVIDESMYNDPRRLWNDVMKTNYDANYNENDSCLAWNYEIEIDMPQT